MSFFLPLWLSLEKNVAIYIRPLPFERANDVRNSMSTSSFEWSSEPVVSRVPVRSPQLDYRAGQVNCEEGIELLQGKCNYQWETRQKQDIDGVKVCCLPRGNSACCDDMVPAWFCCNEESSAIAGVKVISEKNNTISLNDEMDFNTTCIMIGSSLSVSFKNIMMLSPNIISHVFYYSSRFFFCDLLFYNFCIVEKSPSSCSRVGNS